MISKINKNKTVLISVKKITAATIIAVSMTGCFSTKRIGDLTMISTRNVDTKSDYVLLRNYMGGTKKELKRSKAKDLKDAVNNVVKQTPGGEFLKNVKVYIVNGKYFAVEGDVWGLQSGQNMRGYSIGSKVQYPCGVGGVNKCIGIITDLTNDKVCQVKNEETGKVTTEKYSDLKKVD